MQDNLFIASHWTLPFRRIHLSSAIVSPFEVRCFSEHSNLATGAFKTPQQVPWRNCEYARVCHSRIQLRSFIRRAKTRSQLHTSTPTHSFDRCNNSTAQTALDAIDLRAPQEACLHSRAVKTSLR